MHDESLALMKKHLSRIDLRGKNVLDVGSYNINGTYRELIEGSCAIYTGIDIRPGPNVDIVSSKSYRYPFDKGIFDVVICGNTLHNVPRPWILMDELTRLVTPGGLLAVVTIYSWGINSHPRDYFRMTDMGLKELFDRTGMLSNYDLEIDDKGNTAGSAVRIKTYWDEPER